MFTGKLPAREDLTKADKDTSSGRVLSNIIAYHAGEFECNCLDAWEFFVLALQVQNKMTA